MENIYIRFLNKVEEIEYKSIQWGYTSGTLSEDDLFEEAENFLESNKFDELPSGHISECESAILYWESI